MNSIYQQTIDAILHLSAEIFLDANSGAGDAIQSTVLCATSSGMEA